MAVFTNDALFLGNFADADTVEGTGSQQLENTSIYQQTFGSAGDPLYDQVVDVDFDDANGDGAIYTDNFAGAEDISHDLGGGSVVTKIDSVARVDMTVTYTDGTSAVFTDVVMFQDQLGNLFVQNSTAASGDIDGSGGLLIESIDVTNVQNVGWAGINDFSNLDDFASPVDGTSGDDMMGLGYTDGDGDQITIGDDYIIAGDGNDVVNAGHGDDVVYAGAGADIIEDWDGNDTIYAEAGNDTAHIGIGTDTFYMGTGDDTVVVWDNAGVNTIFGGDDFDTLDFGNWQSSDAATVTFTGDGSGTFSHYSGATTGTFSEFEAISGTAYADTIDASADTTGVTLSGEGGDDTVFGGAGDDTIDGGAGDDLLVGDALIGTGPNLIFNGSFEDTTGMTSQYWGYTANGSIPGWTNDVGTVLIDVHNDSRGGLPATDGNNWLDLEGATGEQLLIGQTVAGLTTGDVYVLSFDVGDIADANDGTANDNTLNVIWNGEVIASIDPTDGSWSSYEFTLVGGSGDGSDRLEFQSFGADDSFGASLDNVVLQAAASATDSDDTLAGGAGDDIMHGGGGDDTFVLEDSFGNDTITGGETGEVTGDTIDASLVSVPLTVVYTSAETGTITDGTDTVSFTEVENLILGSGDDVVNALSNTTDLTIDGGAGDDIITGGYGTNTLYGGDGADTFNIGYHTDIITGGEGGTDVDTISIAGADDAITITFTGDEAGTYFDDDGDTGSFTEIEAFELSSGNDVLDGTASNADITVDAGAGADVITGGGGDDTLTGGAGDDTLTGGAGDDTFTYTPGDGADTITDFNSGNSGTLSDGDATNNDFIDLSALYDDIWELHADQADDGILNQSNDGVGGVDYSDNTQFAPGDSLTFTGAAADGSFFTSENTGVVCFAEGTRIRTPRGEVKVEKLKPGDEVVTLDHGPQTIHWIGASEVPRTPQLAPIRIAAGALGQDIPQRPLFVSPQHRMLVRSRIVERMTGAREVLVAAKKLTGQRGIRPDARPGQVRYFHILCRSHEIVFAEGAPAETLLPGPQAQEAMGPDAWAELTAVFPDVAETLAQVLPARPVLHGARLKNMTKRHRRNRAPLLEGA